MNPSIDWKSAIAILIAGVILGVLVVYFNKRRNAPTLGNENDLERNDLEAKRDALVQQLRDPSLSSEERERVELDTADALRRLDAFSGPTGSQPVAAPLAMNPTIKGFIWGATSVAALAALGYFVMQQAKPREEGGEITGGVAQSQPAPATTSTAPTDPMTQQLEAAVKAQPNNTQLRNDLAQAYLERDNLMAVFQQTKIVLEQSPDDSRALTLQGLVRMAMGATEEATSLLQRATKSDPKNLDGWVALAWVYAQSNRMSDAQKMIAEAARQAPQDKARLEQVFNQMQQQLAQQRATPATAQNTLPEGHPAIGETPAPVAAASPAAASSPSASVHVTLDLDPGARQRSGIVFVIARNASGGPPVAVKRVVAGTFPFNVELTSADSMMGQPLPPTFRLEARLDGDGDPMTKPPTDPTAMQDGVAPGASVRLALK
ncbi:MAG TPA: tetratricopeptide repeat protein [Thermoanaerobaculia bacterium]|jgi:tetratricopeptide (TPR) repeat protein|nr:tetratricopeptide repeat protein [Thermoanaerobaculia bacterium]